MIEILDEGKIDVIQRETGLEHHITDEKLTVKLSIDDLRVGDNIDYAYTIVEKATTHPFRGKYFDGTYWLNWSCPVLQQRVRCVNNSKKPLSAVFYKSGQKYQEPSREVIESGQIFDKTFKDLIPSNIDKAAPNWIWSDHLQITTEQTWQELSAHLYQYYLDINLDDLNIDLKDIDGLQLTSNINEDIIAIIRFVQDQIRYKGEHSGIYTHTPKDPDTTLAKRSGDCKDKSHLLLSMLKRVGVESRLLLVNSSCDRSLEQRSPSAYRFNHMIVQVLHQGKSYIFDPTVQKQRGNLEKQPTIFFGWALPIIESGSDLIELKIEFEQDVFRLHHYFDFRQDSKVDNIDGVLEVKRQFYGHRANNFRFFYNSKDLTVIEKEFLEYACNDTQLELEILQGLTVVNDDEINNIFATLEKYQIKNLAKTHQDKKIEIYTKFYQDLPDSGSSNYPILLQLDGCLQHKIDVDYDDVISLDQSEQCIKNDFFEYYDSVRQSNNRLSFETTIKLKNDLVPQSDVELFLQDVDKVKDRYVNTFVTQHELASTKKSDKISWFWALLTMLFLGAILADNFSL